MTEDIAKEKLEPLLKQIGWSIQFLGGDHYGIVDHSGKVTGWILWKYRLEFRGGLLQNFISCFNMKVCSCKIVNKGCCVSVENKKDLSIFALFINSNIDRVDQEKPNLPEGELFPEDGPQDE